jgi:RNA polymerase sigma factor (sigma-70 family)
VTTAPHADRTTRREAAGIVGGLFERHGRMVYGVCRAMLRDGHEAEDATQQVFLSAYQALLGGAHVREAGGWLATIARNECRARIADGMRRPLPVADEDLEGRPAERDEHVRRAHVEELRAALLELPERQREAVVLRYIYGLPYGEVATALGLSRPATEALLFRARRSMRLRLRPVVGAALVVPSVVRDELALALPGFGEGAYGGAAAAGLTGSLLFKLTATPLGLKAATAVVAVSTVGLAGALPAERVERAAGAQTAALGSTEEEAGGAPRVRLPGRDAGRETSAPETASVDRSGSKHGGGEAAGRTSGGGGDSGHGDEAPGDSGDPQTTSSGPGGMDDDGDAVPASEPASAPTADGPDTTDGGSSGGSEESGSSASGSSGDSGDDEIQAKSESTGGSLESGTSGESESSGSSESGESAGGSSGSGSGSSGSGSEEPND